MTETQAKKLAVLTYVLETAFLTNKAVLSLREKHEMNSIANIEAHGKDDFALLKEHVTVGTLVTLKSIFQWIVKYRKTHEGKLPRTLEEWKKKFTKDYDDDLK